MAACKVLWAVPRGIRHHWAWIIYGVVFATVTNDALSQGRVRGGEEQAFQGVFVPEDYSPYQPYAGGASRGGVESLWVPHSGLQSVLPVAPVPSTLPGMPYMSPAPVDPYGLGGAYPAVTPGLGGFSVPQLYPGYGGISPYGGLYNPFGPFLTPGLMPSIR